MDTYHHDLFAPENRTAAQSFAKAIKVRDKRKDKEKQLDENWIQQARRHGLF